MTIYGSPVSYEVSGWEPILSGRLLVRHSASSRMRPGYSAGYSADILTTTKIEIIAVDIEHLHLIEYVLAALAVADLPGKEWHMFCDGGSARLMFTRPSDALNIEAVKRLKSTIRNLAVPHLETAHAH